MSSHAHTGLFSTLGFGGVVAAVQEVARHGPSWSVVPHLLIAGAGFLGAMTSYLNAAQERRHREDIHRADLDARARRYLPKLDTLN